MHAYEFIFEIGHFMNYYIYVNLHNINTFKQKFAINLAKAGKMKNTLIFTTN